MFIMVSKLTTTMVLDVSLLDELCSYKIHPRESYSDCLGRVLVRFREKGGFD